VKRISLRRSPCWGTGSDAQGTAGFPGAGRVSVLYTRLRTRTS
jgi:hypothetical protein